MDGRPILHLLLAQSGLPGHPTIKEVTHRTELFIYKNKKPWEIEWEKKGRYYDKGQTHREKNEKLRETEGKFTEIADIFGKRGRN